MFHHKLNLIFITTILACVAIVGVFGLYQTADAANVNFTLSVWLKPESSIASKAILVKDNEIRLVTDSSGKAVCQIHNGTAWQTAVISNSALSLNTWQHLECTYDGSYLKVFIDGMEQGKQAMTADVQNATSSLYLAKDASGTYGYFQGIADDVRVYNYARSRDEVALDYNAGLAVKLGGSPGTTTPAVHQWRFEEGSGSTAYDGRGQTSSFKDYDWVRPITVTNSTSTLTDYQVSVDLTSVDSLSEGLAGIWHLDGAISGSIANGATAGLQDTSGNSNNGTAYNANGSGMAWTTGVETGALSFDGTDDYVEIPTISIANDISVSAWINSPNFVNSMIVEKDPVNSQWQLFFESSQIVWRVTAVGGVLCTLPSVNQWHMITAVQSGTTARIYIDGEQCGSATLDAIGNGNGKINVGRYGSGYYFNGAIDEVKIYNRAVSADEIKKSYCIGAKRLYDSGAWTKNKYQSANCGGSGFPHAYDWRDIRFSDMNNANLNYWLESDKKAWVKVPTLPGNSNSTIYMYYGNPSASSASNGANTFEFFDDFSDLDYTNNPTWTVIDQGTDPWSASTGKLRRGGNNQGYTIEAPSITTQSGVWEIKQQFEGNASYHGENILAWKDASNYYNIYSHVDGHFKLKKTESAIESIIIEPASSPDWAFDKAQHTFKLTRDQNGNWELFFDGASKGTTTDNAITGFTKLRIEGSGCSAGDYNCAVNWDDIRVRRYALPEPTATVGSAKPNQPVGQVNFTLNAGSGGANTTVAQMWTTSGKYGSALDFDGVDDYASTATALLNSTTFSYSLWFKPTDYTFSSNEYLFSQGTDDPSAYIGTDGKVNVKADGAAVTETRSPLTDTNWRHLEVTADGATLKLYLDGVLQGSASYSGSSINATLYIGAASSTAGFFNGIIDDFRIYNYARGPDDVRTDYNAGLGIKLGGSPATTTPPTHQWRLNTGAGSTGVDSRKASYNTYQYVNLITINNSGSALTDYQVKVELIASLTSSLVSDGKLQSDFDDIRLADANNNLLNFWIETATTSATSTIWVKVPGLSAGTSTIYMYYGNSSAASASNGANTFVFFDDFSTDIGWSFGGQGTISGGVLQDTTTGCPGSETPISSPPISFPSAGYHIEYNVRITSGGICGDYLLETVERNDNTYVLQVGEYYQAGGPYRHIFSVPTFNPTSGGTLSLNTWYTYKGDFTTSGGTMTVYNSDGSLNIQSTITSGDPVTGAHHVGFGYFATGEMDNLIVRKYASPEPTVSVGDSRESNKALELTSGALKDLTLNVGSSGSNTSASQMWTDGIFGKAIEFDGTDDYLSAGNIGNVKTLSFWLAPYNLTQKVLDLDAGTNYIELASGKIDLQGAGWSSPKLYINGAEIGLDSNGQSVSTIRAYEWYHIEIVNGADISATAANFGKVGSSYFAGLMDEIMSYDYGRTASQVLVDYNAGLGIHFK